MHVKQPAPLCTLPKIINPNIVSKSILRDAKNICCKKHRCGYKAADIPSQDQQGAMARAGSQTYIHGMDTQYIAYFLYPHVVACSFQSQPRTALVFSPT
jgi:hypothetical protein